MIKSELEGGIGIKAEKISGTQMAILLFLMVTATGVLFVPSITTQRAKQDAWLASLILPFITGLIVLWVVGQLGKRFPSQTLPQYAEVILGKGPGKLLSVGYILFLLFFNVLVIREFGEFVNIAYLSKTPAWALHTVLMLLAWFAAAKGLEVIARLAQFVLPLFITSFSFILLFSIPEVEPARLLPILEGGIRPLLYASIVPASWFGEVVVLLFFLPQINQPHEVLPLGGWALLAMALFFTLDTLATISVFGPDLSGAFTFPFWSLSRYIQLRGIERIDAFIVLIWVSGVVIKSALGFYVLNVAVAQLFKNVSYRKILFPAAVVQGAAVFWFNVDTFQLMEILAMVWPLVSLMFELVLPLGLLGWTIVTRKGRRKSGS